MDNAIPCPPGTGGISKDPLTRALIREVLAKSLAEMGYECPESELNKFVRIATLGKNKRKARSSSSEEDETCSDSTVVGSDGESESDSACSAISTTERSARSRSGSFTLVEGKNKRAIKKALKKLSDDLPKPRCPHLRRPKGRSPPPRR
ncbi:hypothetical protein EVAR_2674_1 [Eumeta japonica]|uniref:Uncharacterized protein n=1 Tax=Eumeta variegata TaxID=151549 RepID=A0A4C1SPV0_EUMVA|nr:hypothetical protein EVAR_2674_1 [Eumeta japonica]